ncbi:MFS transporter, SIT family, siderophore-iron:H+ symporter, partial [Tremellales sp. Uapishka_1]
MLGKFPLPATPAEVPYTNLLNTQYEEKSTFVPQERHFRRVISAEENPAGLLRVLKQYWNYDSFRHPQEKVCLQVVKGADVLVVAPTGLGKSICFQVPAITLTYGVTIVISPIIALMRDQVQGLKARNIKAEMLCTESSPAEIYEIRRQLGMATPEMRLLYTTPESLFSPKYLEIFRRAYSRGQLRRLVVDEAHVIEEWGMTFRPIYRELGRFRDYFPEVPISAFTASATPEVQEDIRRLLKIPKRKLAQYVLPFNRLNLYYEGLAEPDEERDEEEEGDQREEAKDRAEEIADLIIDEYRTEGGDRNTGNFISTNNTTGLIYCRTVYNCQHVVDVLAKRGIKVRPYYAALKTQVKNDNMEKWKSGEIEVIVATIAFGMGVDQAHVRYVIHYDMPKSFEGYYQETGRAGRDGHVSRCVVFYNREDAAYLRNKIRDESEKAARKRAKEREGLVGVDAEEAELKEEDFKKAELRCLNSFKKLQRFLEDTNTCRHVGICRYFGEPIDGKDKGITKAYCDKMCDICTDRAKVLVKSNSLSEEVEQCSPIEVPVPLVDPPSDFTIPSSDNDPPDGMPLDWNLSSPTLPGSDRDAPPPASPWNPKTNSKSRTNGLRISGVIGSGRRLSEDPPNISDDSHKRKRITAPLPGKGETASSAIVVSASSDTKPDPDTLSSRQKKARSMARAGSPRNAIAGPSRLTAATPVARAPASAFRTPMNQVAGPSRMTSAGRSRTVDEYHDDDNDLFFPGTVSAEDREKKAAAQKNFRKKFAPLRLDGEGDYPCYNSAPMTATRIRSQPPKAFKTPFLKDDEMGGKEQEVLSLVTDDMRRAGLREMQDLLIKRLGAGDLADSVWNWWGRTEVGPPRVLVLKKVGKELEIDIAETCSMDPMVYERRLKAFVKLMKLFGVQQGVDYIIGGGAERHTDMTANQLFAIQEAVKRVKKKKKYENVSISPSNQAGPSTSPSVATIRTTTTMLPQQQEHELEPKMKAGEEGYDEASDVASVEVLTGVSKVEAAQAVWGTTSRWFLFIGIGLMAYIYSLDGVTTYQYLNYALVLVLLHRYLTYSASLCSTSTVLEHSLSGTITTAQGIILAVGKPLMAKIADTIGRAEAFIVVTVLYVVGYIVIATANDVGQIAGGEIIYSFGYTGLQMLQQIVIADMTSLRYRGLSSALLSAPFIINAFVSAQIAGGVLPNWRWGYGMFAILIPVSLLPIIITLLWAQIKAKRLHKIHYSRPPVKQNWFRAVYNVCLEMDLVGLILIACSLALILLPLGLAPEAKNGWKNPSMLAMICVGVVLFPFMIIYEWKIPRKPVVPMRWLRKGPILGACLIGFFDFVSFYLQFTYLYSYVTVTQNWSYKNLTYFSNTQSLALTIFGILAGMIMAATRRFKYMLFGGLLIRLLGVGIMLYARGPHGNTASLVMCQILQGLGGGFAATALQVSAQAAVVHLDVATVTAMVLLITEVGNAVGSAVATGIWTAYMPGQLAKHVPTTNATLLAELYGSITDITAYAVNDPIRLGAIAAYQNVMLRLVLGATIVAIFPPIFCLLFTKDIRLGRAQNAVDGKDLAGRPTEEVEGAPVVALTHGQVERV